MSKIKLKGNQGKLDKVLDFIKNYWYIPLALGAAWYFYRGSKKKVTNKDEAAVIALSAQGVKDEAAQNAYKAITAKLADALGTNSPWYKPVGWFEDDKEAYELVKDLSLTDFKIIKKLYFETYAKGRDLSTDLATLLDNEYYQMLKIK